MRNNLRWAMALLCFGGMAVNYIDRTTISVALPAMSKDLHISPSIQGWPAPEFPDSGPTRMGLSGTE
ncbi:hypothetical protein [Saccharopolyspora sp. NPDC002376]